MTRKASTLVAIVFDLFLQGEVAGVEQDDRRVWNVAAVRIRTGWDELWVIAPPDGEHLGAAVAQPGVELLVARDRVLVIPQRSVMYWARPGRPSTA